jgi:hypothetical protein
VALVLGCLVAVVHDLLDLGDQFARVRCGLAFAGGAVAAAAAVLVCAAAGLVLPAHAPLAEPAAAASRPGVARSARGVGRSSPSCGTACGLAHRQLTSATKPFQHDENKQGTRHVDREGPRQRPVAIRTLGDLGEQSQL